MDNKVSRVASMDGPFSSAHSDSPSIHTSMLHAGAHLSNSQQQAFPAVHVAVIGTQQQQPPPGSMHEFQFPGHDERVARLFDDDYPLPTVGGGDDDDHKRPPPPTSLLHTFGGQQYDDHTASGLVPLGLGEVDGSLGLADGGAAWHTGTHEFQFGHDESVARLFGYHGDPLPNADGGDHDDRKRPPPSTFGGQQCHTANGGLGLGGGGPAWHNETAASATIMSFCACSKIKVEPILIAAQMQRHMDPTMEREAKVMRYREKRKRRCYKKQVRYPSRKAYAEMRPRVNGRFAKVPEASTPWQATTCYDPSMLDLGRFFHS